MCDLIRGLGFYEYTILSLTVAFCRWWHVSLRRRRFCQFLLFTNRENVWNDNKVNNRSTTQVTFDIFVRFSLVYCLHIFYRNNSTLSPRSLSSASVWLAFKWRLISFSFHIHRIFMNFPGSLRQFNHDHGHDSHETLSSGYEMARMKYDLLVELSDWWSRVHFKQCNQVDSRISCANIFDWWFSFFSWNPPTCRQLISAGHVCQFCA